MTAATLIAVYVPFLLLFGILLARPTTATSGAVDPGMVVLSDTGGYAAGVFLGKHPMAPTVSPKKSWEGLAGSLVATARRRCLPRALPLCISRGGTVRCSGVAVSRGGGPR